MDAENASPKAYVEPKMMVIEVDVENMMMAGSNDPDDPTGGAQGGGSEKGEGDDELGLIKQYKFDIWQ